MNKIKATLASICKSTIVRKDAYDLLKVIVGVVLAHYGIKYS